MPLDFVSPYLMDEPPTSTGRVLLSRAFSYWCVLHYGHSDEGIVAALDPDSDSDKSERRQIGLAARLLGELLCAGEIRAFVRPIGAGTPAPLVTTAWERDDFRTVFARSALDPSRPFDDEAAPTHWIFLDAEDFNRFVELSVGDEVGARPPTTSTVADAAAPPAEVGVPGADNHLRMPELERRTGMSRATIYRRIAEKRFPESIR